MIFITSIVLIGGAVCGYFILQGELYPFTVKDFDYNLKHCLQEVKVLRRDASYIKALKKANTRYVKRKELEKTNSIVNGIVYDFKYSNEANRLVYSDTSYSDRLKENNVDDVIKQLKDLGFSVEFIKYKDRYNANTVGALRITVED